MQRQSYLPISDLPHTMGLPMGPKLVKSGSTSTWAKLCGTHVCETAGCIYTIWSFIVLSRLVKCATSWPFDPGQDWIFKVNFLKCCISGMGGPIDMERKGCESIYVRPTLWLWKFCDLTHDLDPWFSRSNFEKVVTEEWDARLTWNERDVSW